MAEAVIVATARSPIGRAHKGSMTGWRADELASEVIGALLAEVPELDTSELTDLVLGCGNPGGEQGFNLARVVAVLAGMDDLPGTTVARYCASSLQAARMAFHAVRAGEGDAFLVAGVEAVSRYVHGNADRIPGTKNPRFEPAAAATDQSWRSRRERGELPDVYVSMGVTAENVARSYGVSRADQDTFALASQTRYARAAEAGFWARDLVAVESDDGTLLDHDESPRPGTTLEALSRLSPSFLEGGTVTAGNACPLNDGAAALVVMSDVRADELGLRPLARIVSSDVAAVDPEIMGMGPVGAVRGALDRAGMVVDDIDLVELNEAFAAQVLACVDVLALDVDRVNVHGGAIAVGHPFGMTGARMLSTAVHGMRATGAATSLVTMCAAGGQGMAMVLEQV